MAVSRHWLYRHIQGFRRCRTLRHNGRQPHPAREQAAASTPLKVVASFSVSAVTSLSAASGSFLLGSGDILSRGNRILSTWRLKRFAVPLPSSVQKATHCSAPRSCSSMLRGGKQHLLRARQLRPARRQAAAPAWHGAGIGLQRQSPARQQQHCLQRKSGISGAHGRLRQSLRRHWSTLKRQRTLCHHTQAAASLSAASNNIFLRARHPHPALRHAAASGLARSGTSGVHDSVQYSLCRRLQVFRRQRTLRSR